MSVAGQKRTQQGGNKYSTISQVSSSSSSSQQQQLRPVSTIGGLGQLFTVYEHNWSCPACNQENFPNKNRCFRCKKSRPVSAEPNYISNPALEALQRGEEIQWQEVVDPASFQIYYYNKSTGVTQWERPTELGPAPIATGWFGRGQAGGSAGQYYQEMNEVYLSRPARQQKEFMDPKKYHTEGANEYNIWHGNYGRDFDNSKNKLKAIDRCKISTDAGYTKADKGLNGRKDRRHFCLHFARGMCTKGSECIYYHRIPLPDDNAKCDELVDIFGRARHKDHREDMDGVGSFTNPSRTLFVGNLLKHKYSTIKELEQAVWKHFSEFGELESCNIVGRLSVAFPRYRLRTSAEFAKEAMAQQSLDHEEILSIRWAHDDPNPMAREAIQRADRDAVTALLQAKGVSIEPAAFHYPGEYELPTSKKTRVDGAPDDAALNYPNTDSQYLNSSDIVGNSNSTGSMTAEQYAYYQQYYAANAVNQSSNPSGDVVTSATTADIVDVYAEVSESQVEDEEEVEVEEINGWSRHVDPISGVAYFYNSSSGESSWVQPADYKE